MQTGIIFSRGGKPLPPPIRSWLWKKQKSLGSSWWSPCWHYLHADGFQEPVQGTEKVPGVMVPEAVPAIGSPVQPEKFNWSVMQYNRFLPNPDWQPLIGQGVSSSLIFTPALSKPPRWYRWSRTLFLASRTWNRLELFPVSKFFPVKIFFLQ